MLLKYLITWFFISLRVVASAGQSNGDEVFNVRCETTKGPLDIEVYPQWSPLGARRFLELVADNFYTDIAFFRCVKGFLTQFGISDKADKTHWHRANIPDDPNIHKGIKKHYLSFAGGGPNTRSTQLFIAFEDLDFLGNEPWETPFGKVIRGTEALHALYTGYGDIPPFGKGPDQIEIYNRGNDYIREMFPHTDFLLRCELATPEQVERVHRMQYISREGDDAGSEGSGEQEAEEEQAVSEDPADAAEKEQGEARAEELIKHFHAKQSKQRQYAQQAEDYAQLADRSDVQARHTTLIYRAVFVLLSGLLVMVLWTQRVQNVPHKHS
eukprot:gene38520-46824_t